MLDIQYIRQNIEKVKQAVKNKNRPVDVDRIITLDDKRKELIQKAQTLRERRNELARNANGNGQQTTGQKPSQAHITEGKQIKEQLKTIEGALKQVEEELHDRMMHVVNVPLDDTPIGPDASGNVELRTWGEKPTFDFEPKDHITLMENLGWLDLERGSKVSGFRGYFLKGEGALLQIKLLMWAFNELAKKGYTPMIAPAIVKEFALFGTGHFPWGSEQDVYALNEEDAFLAGTAEVPITSYYAGEVLHEKDLPIRMVGFSPCYRREAGAYGKDTRGIYRVHEFMKVEQVIIGRNDMDEAITLHEELQKNTEDLLQKLGLPYRVLRMCTGDMGEPQIKKYDTEAWIPSKQAYGEVGSNSIMGDFQARRLNLRYKAKDGGVKYCFTFNNTALAAPRILIPLVENGQKEDGGVEYSEFYS
ncbi:serine--tRNA ligase [Candidatus Woesebacteria bacterium]|nr:serine--tRNA ligase [Candidatus Woesebacteria bacterium]